MGKLCPVLGILACIVNRIWDELSMCNPITSQLVRHDLPGFVSMCLQQSFEEALCGLAAAPTLQKNIDDFSVLIHGSPQIALYTVNLHEYFIYIKGITKSLVAAFQTSSILGSELVAPQPDGFISLP